jgi:hypothetical protein
MNEIHYNTQIEWNGACALNSMTITMMQRSSYQQAEDTLSDALQVIQQVQSPTDVLEKLESAKRRLFSPEQQQLLAVHNPLAIKVIHHDGAVEGSDEAFQGLRRPPRGALHPPSKFALIRMEADDISTSEASAIILHNSAICWLCRSTESSEADIAAGHAQRATRILRQALGILHSLYTASACPFTMFRVISLMILIGNVLDQESLVQQEEATALLAALDRAAMELASSGLFSYIKSGASAA